jgi:hypothetical protein
VAAVARRNWTEEIEMAVDNKQLVHMSMSACEHNNPGARIALYLDETMLGPDGENYLPVMNIERSGQYALFVPEVQQSVAEFFGSSLEDAQARVGEINTERGMAHDEVLLMVAESMSIAADRRR